MLFSNERRAHKTISGTDDGTTATTAEHYHGATTAAAAASDDSAATSDVGATAAASDNDAAAAASNDDTTTTAVPDGPTKSDHDGPAATTAVSAATICRWPTNNRIRNGTLACYSTYLLYVIVARYNILS